MRGQKAMPLVNSNVSSTNMWCKLSHCCRSLSHDWMSLDRFGQADELFLLCWSHCLCMNYASPFGTDESAWDKWWNLRPSPTVRDWQVTCKTGTFLGFTDDFIIKLVLKSIQDRRQLFPPKTQWHGMLSKRSLHCDKVRQDIPFTFLLTYLWTLEQEIEDLKGHGSFRHADPRWSYPWRPGTHYPVSRIFKHFKKTLSICNNFVHYYVSLLCLGRESTVVLDKNKTLLETWK